MNSTMFPKGNFGIDWISARFLGAELECCGGIASPTEYAPSSGKPEVIPPQEHESRVTECLEFESSLQT